MNRREFMVAASGVAGGLAAASAATPVAAQEDNASDGSGDGAAGGGNESAGNESAGNESASGGGGGGGGGTEEVVVGPGGDPSFDPSELTIQPGTTVVWTWDSDNHNIHPDSDQPDGAEWEGHLDTEDAGFEYEHTFEVEGEYGYVCDPHVGQGMEGTIVVDPDASAGGGGGHAEVEVHDLGVPIQAHYVGIATILAIFVSLAFTFYLLKYGESAHTSSPGRK